MSGWWPKGSPSGGARSPAELADWELAACLDHAEDQISAEPHHSARRRRLQEWLRALLAERADRAQLRQDRARRAAG